MNELTYRADRKPEDVKSLEDIKTQEEYNEWIKSVMKFRDALAIAKDAVQKAYDVSPSPHTVEYMEEMLRSMCMIDCGYRGLLKAIIKDIENDI